MDILVALKAVTSDFEAKMAVARMEMQKTATAGQSHFGTLSNAFGKAALGITGAAVVAGFGAMKMAADFQSSMTSLVTGAGESEKNIKMVSQGILDMAPKVGETTQQLAAGMYMIESAGYHGATGLTVLKAAAQGAKVGAADLGTVADALTTALNDYHIPASKAADITSKLVATVAAGKTHMQDLAGSLAAVLPAASAAGVGLDQVLGAMATMTAKGTPAADAATYLRQTILQLENPTKKASTEMMALGLSAIDISSHLGQRGLTGTFQLLTDAIQNHMGPAGTVLIEQLQKASAHTSTFQQILANLPPVQQTYVSALANMVGGTKSMQAALELTGASSAAFNANVVTIAHTTADAGGAVKGWSTVQKDANEKFAEAKARLEVLGIELGTKLIPIFEKVVQKVMEVVNWFSKHQEAARALAAVITGVLGVAITAFAINKIAQFVGGISNAIGALNKFATRSKETAAVVEGDNAAMGASGVGFGSMLSKGLGIAAAGALAFQGTTALLKSNFLGIGDAVNKAAKAISDFFGGIGQVKPSTSLAPQAIAFLEQVASGAVVAANITAAAAAQDLHEAGVPGYATGTSYVPRTGLALLHQGEAVIPAGQNAGHGGGDLIIKIGEREAGRVLGPVVRDWLVNTTGRNETRGILKT